MKGYIRMNSHQASKERIEYKLERDKKLITTFPCTPGLQIRAINREKTRKKEEI
jgi:hypothetical protein